MFGLQAPEVVTAGSLSALAAGYAAAIGRTQPQGPSTLIGWSYGAFVAAETARQLHQAGAQVELVLIDPVCRADFAFSNRATLLRLIANGKVQVPLPDHLEQLDPDAQLACFARSAVAAGVLAVPAIPHRRAPGSSALRDCWRCWPGIPRRNCCRCRACG